MGGLQDRGGVYELVADRVDVATREIQPGGRDPGRETVAPRAQPTGVGSAGTARDPVEQPCQGRSFRLLRYTMPVSSFGPFRGLVGGARCVSRRQESRRRPNRAWSSASSAGSGWIADQRCASPLRAAAPLATDAASFRRQPSAHHTAPRVSFARGSARSASSLNPRTGKAGSAP